MSLLPPIGGAVTGRQESTAVGRPGAEAAVSRPAARVSSALDLAVLSALGLFVAWTVVYLAALAGVVPSEVAFWAWVGSSPAVVVLVVRKLGGALGSMSQVSPWAPLAVCVAFAVGAVLVVRPDLDDASYVVRSTWIAANGDVRVGDVIFSDGSWPGLPAQTPYLASVEALFGWLARGSGVSAGSVVYLLYPPVAAFGAGWALWMLLRSWHVRRPVVGLALASLFLLMGGATHASWGNLHLARIWQGKVTFLAIVVPLLFAACAWCWTARDRTGRRAA